MTKTLAELTENDSFVLLFRHGKAEGFLGTIEYFDQISDLPTAEDFVFLNPYVAIKNRGLKAHGSEKLQVLRSAKKITIGNFFVENLPDLSLKKSPIPDIGDEIFIEKIHRLQQEEIGKGNACQVILSRNFFASIQNFSFQTQIDIWKKLCRSSGAYITFLWYDAAQKIAYIGASPERHAQITESELVMTPIAGTFPKKKYDDFSADFPQFLRDKKEIDELSQVLDEELKIMAHLCPRGGAVTGPFFRETPSAIHTEYKLTGHRDFSRAAFDQFTHTLHAPTLVGGPMQSAAEIIHRYEDDSRRFYGGEIGIWQDGVLDSAIIIRTAEIDPSGRATVRAGCGVVQTSDPQKEADETTAKANGFFRIFSHDFNGKKWLNDTTTKKYTPLLHKRNKSLSSFLLDDHFYRPTSPIFDRIRVKILDHEDYFSYMLHHFLCYMGFASQVVEGKTYDFSAEDNTEIFILGPGPGDINNPHDERMKNLQTQTKKIYGAGRKIFGVCLGHQALARHFGIPVELQSVPTQGIAREEDLLGRSERLAFYNSFSPVKSGKFREEFTFLEDRLLAFFDKNVAGVQCHLESVMSPNGYDLLAKIFRKLLTNT